MNRKLFVRESSGLIKEVNALDAIMLNLGNMSAGVALFDSISPYITGGTVLWIAGLIGMLLSLPQAYIYIRLTKNMARTGGDYVWISRIINGPLGISMAIALMLESTAFFALVAFFFSGAIGSVLSTIGTMDGISSLVSISNTISTPVWSYAIGAILFAFIIGFNIFKAKWGYKLVTVSTLFALITTFIAIGVIAVNIPDFSTAITPFLQKMNITPPPSYTSSIPPFSWAATFLALPLFAIFTYPWMQATPAVAAEVKKLKYVEWGVLIPLLMSGLLITLGFGVLYAAGGYYLNTYEFTTYPNQFIYTFWTVAMGLTSNPVLQWIIGIGLMSWEFAVLAYGVIVFARYMFAMSFDRVLPEIFTRLNRSGSPVYTHILDLALTLSLLVLPVVSINGATALYGAIVIGMIYFLVVSIAGLRIGLKGSDIKLILASVFEAAYFIFLTYEAVTNPVFSFVQSNGMPNPITLGFVIGSFVVGAVIYYVSKVIRLRREGINIDLIFKEIPPE